MSQGVFVRTHDDNDVLAAAPAAPEAPAFASPSKAANRSRKYPAVDMVSDCVRVTAANRYQ